MAVNLTTRYLYKLHAGITATSQNTLIDYLIDQVSEAIAAYCGRTFEATTYKRWLDGAGTDVIVVPQCPITNVYGVTADIKDVGEIKFAGAGTWASVSVKDGVMTLDSINNSAVESSTNITLASNATMSALETAVEAVSGWQVAIDSGEENDPSTLLRPFIGAWALDPDDVDLELPDETSFVRIRPEGNQSIVSEGGTFPSGTGNVFVWYKAGYTLPAPKASDLAPTTAGNVPGDLTLICNEIIKVVLDMTASSAVMGSERIGNYSYTKASGGGSTAAAISNALGDQSSVLYPHRSVRIH